MKLLNGSTIKYPFLQKKSKRLMIFRIYMSIIFHLLVKFKFSTQNIAYIGELGGENCNFSPKYLDVAYQEVAKLLMYDKNLTFAHVNINNLNPDLAQLMDVKGSFNNYIIKIYNKNGNNAEYNKDKVDHMDLKNFITNGAYSDLKSATLNCKFSERIL